MRRYFYVYMFWDLFQMNEVQKADVTKYAIVKYSYKDYPVFVISEDTSLSDYLAGLEDMYPVERYLVEMSEKDGVIPPYYQEDKSLFVITGNEKMLNPGSM